MRMLHWTFPFTLVIALAAGAATPAQLGKAIEAQSRLAEQRPDDVTILNDLGNLLALAGRAGEAEEAYRRALEVEPASVDVRYNLALHLHRQGRSREAMRHYQAVVKAAPNHAWAHYQIGAIHEKEGRSNRAVRAYSRAFALDPQLAFSEVNPHVLDSRLVTRALMRAYDRRRDLAAEAPMAYRQPTRLATMLLDPPLASQPPAVAETAEEVEGAGRVLTKEDLGRRGRVGQATPLREVEQARRQAGGARERAPARQLGGRAESDERTRDEEGRPRRGSSSPWVQWMEQRQRQEGEDSESEPGGRRDPGAFTPRPGEPSTARLDMELFAIEPAR